MGGGGGGFDCLGGFVTARLGFVLPETFVLLLSELVVVFTLVRFGSGFMKLNMTKKRLNKHKLTLIRHKYLYQLVPH
jgi:hypothetical protein